MTNRINVLESQLPGVRNIGDIVVLGACFVDFIAYVDRLPNPGETLPCHHFGKGFGGKGANQAVMAGRLGAVVKMVSVVGDDGDGNDYIANLKKNGINTTFVTKVPEESTGLAMISVDTKTAQNSIVICPNATRRLVPPKDGTLPFLSDCGILVCQNEIPLSMTLQSLKAAHERGVFTVLNAAPAPTPDQVQEMLPYLKYVSLFCPNETEAQALTGIDVRDVESALAATKALQKLGVPHIVVTLGDKGYILAEQGKEAVHVNGLKVRAVDTTGAGDCFVGAMVYFLQAGDSLGSACRKANVCAAFSVQRKGTQSSYPFRADLPKELFV